MIHILIATLLSANVFCEDLGTKRFLSFDLQLSEALIEDHGVTITVTFNTGTVAYFIPLEAGPATHRLINYRVAAGTDVVSYIVGPLAPALNEDYEDNCHPVIERVR